MIISSGDEPAFAAKNSEATKAEIKRQLDAGHLNLRNGDPQTALTRYQDVLALQPGHTGALGGIGAAFSRLGRINEAIDALRDAIAVAPTIVGFPVQLGNLLNRQANPAGAVAAFRAALALDPNHAGAAEGLATALGRLSALDEATGRDLKEGQTSNLNVDLHVQLGHELIKKTDWKGATEAFRNALVIDPAHAGANSGLAKALEQQGSTEEAISTLQAAIQLAPNNAGLLVQLGGLLNRQRKREPALAVFRAALALDSRQAGAMAGMASIFNQQGKTEDAIAAIRAAIELAPGNVGLHIQLGQLLEEQHRLELAQGAFQLALRADPHNLSAQAGLRRVRDPAIIFEYLTKLLKNPADIGAAERLCKELDVSPETLSDLVMFARDPDPSAIAKIATTPVDNVILQVIARTVGRRNFWKHHGTTAPLERLQVAPPSTNKLAAATSHESWTAAQWVNAFLLRQAPVAGRVAAVVPMRDDGLYAIEWIAHYRVLGVEAIFVYSNDDVDGSELLFRELAKCGVITYIENQMGADLGSDPQKKAFAHSLHMLPELWEYEWVCYMDSDELLMLNPAYGGRIEALIDDALSHCPERAPSAICFNWLWYVSGQTYAYEPKPLLRRFQHAVERRGMKSLVRLRDIFSMHRVHFPEMAPGGFLLKSDFTHLDKDQRWHKTQPVFASAQLNHYWSKSFEEFSLKKARGDATNHDIWKRSFELFFLNNSDETQDNFAPPSKAHVSAVETEIERLMALPGVADHVTNIIARLPQLLRRFDNEGGLRTIYDNARAALEKHPRPDDVS